MTDSVNSNSDNENKIPVNIGPYVIKKKIREGGYSVVSLATSKISGDEVAVKSINKNSLHANIFDLSLVHNEVEILKILKHKNILSLYQLFESPKYIHIVTEVLNGKDLFEQIISKKKFEEGEAKELFFQIIDAMIYMHSMFICHRDIKSENILFDKNNPKIIDFGFATFYKKGKKLKEAFGSPSYACPEMQKGSEYDPEKADVWSCGVLLYVMVNGYLPFSEEDDEKNKELIIKGDFYMPKELSAPLKDLLKHMLEPNEDNRFDFGKIGNHEWFKGCPVMTGGLNIFDLIYPVDDRVIKAVNYFGIDKDKVSDELKKNKFTNATGVYKQIVKRVVQSGMMSYSDLQSMEYKSYKRLKEHRVKKEEGEKMFKEYLDKQFERMDKVNIIEKEFDEKEKNVVKELDQLKEECLKENENNKEIEKKEEEKKEEEKKEEPTVMKRKASVFNNRRVSTSQLNNELVLKRANPNRRNAKINQSDIDKVLQQYNSKSEIKEESDEDSKSSNSNPSVIEEKKEEIKESNNEGKEIPKEEEKVEVSKEESPKEMTKEEQKVEPPKIEKKEEPPKEEKKVESTTIEQKEAPKDDNKVNITNEEKKEQLPVIENKIPEKKEEPPKDENKVSVIPESINKTDTIIQEQIEDKNTNKEVKTEDTTKTINKEKIIVNETAKEDNPILNKSEEPLKVVDPIVLERTEVSLTEKKDMINISNKGSISNTQKSLPKIEEQKKVEASNKVEEEKKEYNKPIIENESNTTTSNKNIPVIPTSNEKKEEIKDRDKPKEDDIPKVDKEEYKKVTSSPIALPPSKKSITSPYEPPRELQIDIPSLDIQSDFTEKINDATVPIPKKPNKTKSKSRSKEKPIPEFTKEKTSREVSNSPKKEKKSKSSQKYKSLNLPSKTVKPIEKEEQKSEPEQPKKSKPDTEVNHIPRSRKFIKSKTEIPQKIEEEVPKKEKILHKETCPIKEKVKSRFHFSKPKTNYINIDNKKESSPEIDLEAFHQFTLKDNKVKSQDNISFSKQQKVLSKVSLIRKLTYTNDFESNEPSNQLPPQKVESKPKVQNKRSDINCVRRVIIEEKKEPPSSSRATERESKQIKSNVIPLAITLYKINHKNDIKNSKPSPRHNQQLLHNQFKSYKPKKTSAHKHKNHHIPSSSYYNQYASSRPVKPTDSMDNIKPKQIRTTKAVMKPLKLHINKSAEIAKRSPQEDNSDSARRSSYDEFYQQYVSSLSANQNQKFKFGKNRLAHSVEKERSKSPFDEPKRYKGPIDMNCISHLSPEDSITYIIEKLHEMNVSIKKRTKWKFYTKNFSIEIRYIDNYIVYFLMQFKLGMGEDIRDFLSK